MNLLIINIIRRLLAITTHQPKCGGFGGLTDIYYISGGFYR